MKKKQTESTSEKGGRGIIKRREGPFPAGRKAGEGPEESRGPCVEKSEESVTNGRE